MSASITGMRSIFFEAPGGPEVLRLREEPRPRACKGELLVRVLACGVNGADLNLRSGRTRAADASGRPGLEVCGVVEQLGPGVDPARSPSATRWSVGDAVCALVAGGGYAEYVSAPVEQCLPLPRGIDALHAAGIIETAATVWDNVFIRAGLAAGEVFLVHGGASGIGTTAIQLARARGARVFATAGSAQKAAMAKSLGAERCFEYRREDFVAGLQAAAGGADVILDVAGAGYLARNLAVLNMDGRLVVIAVNVGAEATLDLRQLMQKRAVITGSILKSRTPAQKRSLLEAVWREVWPLYADGRMEVVLGNVLPLARASEAHAAMEAGGVIGKTILDCRA